MNIKQKLDESYIKNNTIDFVKSDPISIPHNFSKKEDIEISAFLTSILAFGRRNIIINKSNELMNRLSCQPYNSVMNMNYDIVGFKHRTINDEDILYYLQSLKNIYINYGGLQELFDNDIEKSLIDFWKIFFSLPHNKRSERNISNIEVGSAGKRLNMFLRWMVRKDNIDFGIWNHINKSNLFIPLDVHVANMSRILDLLTRKQNDWKSVIEITNHLRIFDKNDPIKYDISLFNLDL